MGQPNSKDLSAFVTVAEELSFRRAAERLFLDQSALSRRIQNLEDSLGYKLIFRTTREVTLSEAGKVFYEEIRPALNALHHAGNVAKKAAEGKTGRLKLGYMSFAATEAMPDAVHAFSNLYPEVALDLSYHRTQAQKIALSRGEIDAGYMLGPFDNPQYEKLRVVSEKLVAVVPMDHWLSTRPSVTLSDLAECKMILGSLDQWDFFRLLIDDLFSNNGLQPQVAYEPSNTLGILGLVSRGLGVSIYAEGLMRFQPQRVMFKPIVDCHIKIETLLCWNRSNQSSALRNFVRVAKSLAKSENNGAKSSKRQLCPRDTPAS